MPDVQLYSQPGRILLHSEYWANRGVVVEKERGLTSMKGRTERAPTSYPMAKDPSRKPHVVLLHGTACNNSVLKTQLRELLQGWQEVDVTFIEGHRVIPNPHHPTAKMIAETFNTQNHREYLETHPCDKEAKLYGMFDSAIGEFEANLKKETNGRPVDALLGFSQGALFATLMAARALKCEDAPPPFKCVVLLNPPNPVSLTERAGDFFTSPLGTPALICKGETDDVVTCERVWEKGVIDDGPGLYEPLFDTIQWTSHPDGHQPMPAEAADAKKLAKEIKAFIKKYC
jgi:predicted esterase